MCYGFEHRQAKTKWQCFDFNGTVHIVDRHQHDTVFIFTVARLGIVPSIEEPEDFTKTCITRNDFLYLLLFSCNKGRDRCLFSKSSLTWGIQRKCDLCTQYNSYKKDKQYLHYNPIWASYSWREVCLSWPSIYECMSRNIEIESQDSKIIL